MSDRIDLTANVVTEAINLHGVFFKRAVRTQLESLPGVRVLGEEYPVRYMQGVAVDLLVQVDGHHKFILPIECKRAYVSAKRWVFFENPDVLSKLCYVFEGKRLVTLGASLLKGHPTDIAVDGIQIQQKKDQLISDPSPIWDAAFQVCKGAHGFIIEELNQRKTYVPAVGALDFLSMPVVVTSAPLQVCPLSTQKVDLKTGNHIGEAKFKDVKWLILSFPFAPSGTPGEEHLKSQPIGYATPYERGGQLTEGVFVVNAEALGEFITWLQSWE